MSFEMAMLTMYLAVGSTFAGTVIQTQRFKEQPVRTGLYALVLTVIWGFLIPLVIFEVLFGEEDETDIYPDSATTHDECDEPH